jgi:mono/diheme cytochrome c family protein
MKNPNAWMTALFATFLVLAGALAETTEQIHTTDVPLQIPDDAKAMPNPLAGTDQNVALGSRLYASQCAMCHGSAGAGDGALATRLKIEMPDFTDAAGQTARTDGELFYILSHGHGHMPAETRLPEDSRWAMVLAIRAMAR